MFSMANFLPRFKASPQSQVQPGHSTISRPHTPLNDSKISANTKMKGPHLLTANSSSSNVTSTRERELNDQLLEKEVEIEQLRARYESNISRREHEIGHLRHDQTILRGALDKKDSDLLESSNGFRAMLDEKDKNIDGIRGYYVRILHAQEGQQRDSKILQRKADAETEALLEKLTTAEQQLELCRDDLFRMQPVCRISDGNIMAVFESLGEQLVNWIDNETSDFEKAYPGAPDGWLFSGSKDSNVAYFLRMYPLAGEYLCRNMVNHYLSKDMFGTNARRWGVSAEYAHMRSKIEDGMAALTPPRDAQTINIWRAETLSALGATQEYRDLRESQSIRWTKSLFQRLSTSFPNLFGLEEVMKRFHHQVTTPAMTIATQLQGLASPYRLGMVEQSMLKRERLTKDDISKVTAIDLETGRSLKPASLIASDREGVIGEFVLSLEPSLHRVNEDTSEIELRKEIWLVRLDHPLGGRAPNGD